jgi:molybdate transport system substrate-binding protein
MRVFSIFAIVLFCCRGVAAEAAEIRIVTSPGLSAVFKVLGPQFERETGNTVSFRYGLQAEQKKQIEAGDFDLAIVPSDVLDGAIKAGKVVAATRIAVARVDLGAGVRAGAAKPDLSSVDAFKRAMLAAQSVAYVADEPTGMQIASDFEKLGIAEIMKAKTKPQKTVALVWKSVASGDAELGFGFASNILSVGGVELAGHFPAELQYFVEMTAGVASAAQAANGAAAFIKYMRTPEAASALKASGLALPAE